MVGVQAQDVHSDPAKTMLADVEAAVRATTPIPGRRTTSDQVDVPVTYDGEDLDDVAVLLGCDAVEVVAYTGQ